MLQVNRRVYVEVLESHIGVTLSVGSGKPLLGDANAFLQQHANELVKQWVLTASSQDDVVWLRKRRLPLVQHYCGEGKTDVQIDGQMDDPELKMLVRPSAKLGGSVLVTLPASNSIYVREVDGEWYFARRLCIETRATGAFGFNSKIWGVNHLGSGTGLTEAVNVSPAAALKSIEGLMIIHGFSGTRVKEEAARLSALARKMGWEDFTLKYPDALPWIDRGNRQHRELRRKV